MSQPWIYMFSPSWSPLPPPSPSPPSGSSQGTSPEHLSHASLGWRSVSHLIICMFQCYSLRSSHPHLLPQSPKVCSVHLCLFFCPAYRVMFSYFKMSFSLFEMIGDTLICCVTMSFSCLFSSMDVILVLVFFLIKTMYGILPRHFYFA